jgi:hypothetical protein
MGEREIIVLERLMEALSRAHCVAQYWSLWTPLSTLLLIDRISCLHLVFLFRSSVFSHQSEWELHTVCLLSHWTLCFPPGSLIKLVYFSRHADTEDKRKLSTKRRLEIFTGARRSYPVLGGRLHFVKFETGKLNECLDFISSKQLHRGGMQTLLRFNTNYGILLWNLDCTHIESCVLSSAQIFCMLTLC